MIEPKDSARDHLALALDVDDLVVALRIADPLLSYFAVAKVGPELFFAAGPEAIVSLSAAGFKVFVDAKLHDIPTTVGKAARVIGGLGASYVTVHTSGGYAMVAAAVSGIEEGSRLAGLPPAHVLGVTVLTSDVEAPIEELERRTRIAAEAGCAGVVCAGTDLEVIEAVAPGLIKVVPGIRPSEIAPDDQVRIATPGAALRAGADLLVIGRAVTSALDPRVAAESVRAEVAEALGELTPR
jgi:orotidine-5'-phosphate decarboxylase